jgi:hypothetical protein
MPSVRKADDGAAGGGRRRPYTVAAVPAPEILLVELRDVIGIDVGAPLATYLSRLGSPESRRVMRSSLDTIARAVSGGTRDAQSFPWPALRYPHTAAIRAWLNERASPRRPVAGRPAARQRPHAPQCSAARPAHSASDDTRRPLGTMANRCQAPRRSTISAPSKASRWLSRTFSPRLFASTLRPSPPPASTRPRASCWRAAVRLSTRPLPA